MRAVNDSYLAHAAAMQLHDAAAPFPHLMQKLWPQLPHASLLHERVSRG